MQSKLKKGLKPFFLNYLAMFIGICYLANPLQNQISTVFHEISHVLEIPDNLLSHETTLNHGTISHYYHEHNNLDDNHRHTIIDFLDAIFDASGNNEPSEESLPIDIKFDKHITTRNYTIKIILPASKQVKYGIPENKINTGHLIVLEKPPRNFLL